MPKQAEEKLAMSKVIKSIRSMLLAVVLNATTAHAVPVRNLDSDNDLVLDAVEDADVDGIADGDGCPDTDPPLLNARPDARDTDGDGLTDALEKRTCTDWQVADTDADGRVDGVEDRDRDGALDLDESDPCAPDLDPRGGAGCSAGPGANASPAGIVLIAVFGLGLLVRRRNTTGQQSATSRRRCVP